MYDIKKVFNERMCYLKRHLNRTEYVSPKTLEWDNTTRVIPDTPIE